MGAGSVRKLGSVWLTHAVDHTKSVLCRRGGALLAVRRTMATVAVKQEPSGMENIAASLEEFLQVPTASRAWFLPAPTPALMVIPGTLHRSFWIVLSA